MKKISTLVCVAFSLLVLSSCSKKKDDPAPAPTKTDNISKSNWKFDKATAGGVDVSANVTACLKDNVVLFVSNGTGSVDEGASVCAPSYAGAFTWSFQTNETMLHISSIIFPGGSNDFTLVSLDDTKLVASQMMTFAPFPPTLVEVTFKH